MASSKQDLLNEILKPGEYWIDLFEHPGRSGTQLWAQYQATHGAVKTITTQEIEDSDPLNTWVKFKVLGPTATEWPKALAVKIGFPTPIQEGQDVEESADTGTAEDVLEHLEETGEDGTNTAKTLMLVGIAAGAVALAIVVSPFVAAWLSNRRKTA